LRPLFEQLIPTVEALTVNQLTGRAEKAHLPASLIKEIERDAKWSAVSKNAVNLAAPQVAAKWLNKSGISAENQPELVLGTALATIFASHTMLLRRLDKLIASRPTAPDVTRPAGEGKP
jgi:hypothetical protein